MNDNIDSMYLSFYQREKTKQNKKKKHAYEFEVSWVMPGGLAVRLHNQH